MPLGGRSAILAFGVALALTGALVGVGTALAEEDDAAPGDQFQTTPLADYDTSTVVVLREGFCDHIDPRQVEAALDALPEIETIWENGDRLELPSGERDAVHEYGCEFVSADGTTARAWVFAPPVASKRARRLAKAASATEGCRVTDGPAFGDPSVGLSCVGAVGYVVAHRGLFGDAWLTCELSGNPEAVETFDLTDFEDRGGRWCVGVAMAASS